MLAIHTKKTMNLNMKRSNELILVSTLVIQNQLQWRTFSLYERKEMEPIFYKKS